MIIRLKDWKKFNLVQVETLLSILTFFSTFGSSLSRCNPEIILDKGLNPGLFDTASNSPQLISHSYSNISSAICPMLISLCCIVSSCFSLFLSSCFSLLQYCVCVILVMPSCHSFLHTYYHKVPRRSRLTHNICVLSLNSIALFYTSIRYYHYSKHSYKSTIIQFCTYSIII